MEGSELNGQLQASSERIHHQRPSAPKPPKPYSSMDNENEEDSLTNGDSRMGKKPNTSKDRPAFPPRTTNEGGHGVLARAGETILETFYGMLYKCEDDTKEWKLAADGFIPLCFIQEQGNANKPFKLIAVHGSVRVLEFPVTKDTKCTQNKAFVKWNESNNNMFGVRLSKETHADQFHSAMSRMKSTLLKTAELFKQPERKAMVSQMSDHAVEGPTHRKTSLIVKLPNKETTVMSVPGLITMGELFEHVCKKEELSPNDHELSLPKVGSKELKFEPDTVLGTLKIREISIRRSSSDSAMSNHESSKEHKASAAKTPAIPQPYAKQDERPASKQTPKLERNAEQAETGKNVPPVKPDSAKVKRRAPPPPQRPPPERPKSMPVARPRTVPSSPGPPQAKKRQAPSRPPAPKVLRDIRYSNETSTSNMKRSVSAERLPPIFCPPPPPDDLPPPLDECEYPVSPLSDDDLHETSWITSSGDHREVTSHVSSNKSEQPDVPQLRKTFGTSETGDPEDRSFASPEPIPLKFLMRSSESPVENADDLTDERQGVSSRISFVGDSRSSSVDITSDNEFPTSPIFEGFKPIKGYEPMELTENVSINTDMNTTEQEPQRISPPPPPSGFSSESLNVETAKSNSENIESPEYDIESMVIPPPPVMFDDSTESQDAVSEESDEVPASDVAFSIPPPSDFAFQDEAAKPPAEFGDEETSTRPKKKLGMNSDVFPWLTETQPVFQAEISNSTLENETENLPVPEIPNEKISVKEEHVVSASRGSRDVPILEVPQAESNEKLEIESSYKDHMSSISSSHVIETPDLYKDSVSQQPMKLNDERNLELPSKVESDQLVPEYQEIPVPATFKDEQTHHLNEESHRGTETSSESSSSTFKTPFDDLESIEYSEGSLNSEIEDDIMFDLKVTTMTDKESHAEVINQDQTTTNTDVSDTFVKLELLKEKEESLKEETKEDHSLGLTSNELTQYDKHDESKGEKFKDSKFSEETVVSESTVITSDYSVSSASSGNNVSTGEVIELSNATPIAIPVDILFQSLGPNTTSEVTDLQGDDKDKAQTRPGLKRPVGSGFKTQSWADIKNREKEMEKQRQQKNSSKSTQDTSVSSSQSQSSGAGIGSTKTTSMEYKSSSSQLQKEKEDISEIPKMTPLPKPTSTPIMSTSVEGKLSSSTVQSKPPNDASIPRSTYSVVESTVAPSTAKSDLEALNNTNVASSTSLVYSLNDQLPSTTEVASKSKSTTDYSKSSNISSSTSEQSSSKYKLSSSQSSQSTSMTSSDSTTLKEKYSFNVETRKPNYVESAHHVDSIFPSMLESSKGKSTSTQVVKKSDNTTSSTQRAAAVEPRKPNYVASASTKTTLTPSSMESSKETPSSTEVANKTDDENSSSSQGVVMRQKTEKPDSAEKRKSVHDMMRMFQDPLKRERSDSNEGLPRQSPALRIIEEKVNYPYRQHSSSGTTETTKSSDSIPSEKESDSAESLPRQSPAMRLLEGKISNPNRSSSKTSSTTKSSTSDSTPSEEENNNLKGPTKSVNETEKVSNEQTISSSLQGSNEITEAKQKEARSSDAKPRTSSSNQRKSYGVLFPREYKPPSHSVQTSTTKPKETEKLDTKPRPNSISSRQKYEVLFPKEQKTLSNSVEANVSVESKKQDGSTSHLNLKETKRQSIDEKVSVTKVHEERKTIETVGKVKHKQSLDEGAPKSKSEDKKEIAGADKSQQRRSIDESVLTKNVSQSKKDDTPNTDLVIKRKKESSTVPDASKRYSMPVHLMESASSSQKQSGGNLKILLAPQISDVGVVPKGRVAAMMAAWKKDDEQ